MKQKKLRGPQLVKKFPTYHGTRRFITVMNPAHALTPYFRNIHVNIILPSAPRFSKLSLSFRFPYHSTVCISFLRYTCDKPRLLHPSWLYTLIIFGEEQTWWSSSLFSLLQPPGTPTVLHTSTSYLPQHRIIEHLQPTFFPYCGRPSSTPSLLKQTGSMWFIS